MVKPAFVFDGRNILKKEKMENLGYIYYCIGKWLNTFNFI